MLPTSTIINSPPQLTDQQKQLLLALVGRVTDLERRFGTEVVSKTYIDENDVVDGVDILEGQVFG